MLKVSIIGSGNVAHHLIKAFAASEEIELVQIFARQKNSLIDVADNCLIITDLSLLIEADLYIIAVSDSAIGETSQKLPFKDRLVVHTSGAMELAAISERNRSGSFYPLQTFSKSRNVNMKTVPICIESQNSDDLNIIKMAAASISDRVYKMDSAQRRSLHVAAVFACNFTNHMYDIADEICAGNGIAFEIMHPLIIETASKILTLSPAEAQTGPAKRNDTVTIDRHIDFLQDTEKKKIYTLISNSISKHAKKL